MANVQSYNGRITEDILAVSFDLVWAQITKQSLLTMMLLKKLPTAPLLFFALFLVLSQRSNHCAASATSRKEHDVVQTTQSNDRQVWAWATTSERFFPNKTMDDLVQQLYDYPDLIDGLQLFCGCYFNNETTGLSIINETLVDKCRPLLHAARETNTKVQLMIGNKVPDTMNPVKLVHEALAINDKYFDGQLNGFSFDDESSCAPRATTGEFEKFTKFQNEFANELEVYGLSLTSAIQAVFGIQNDESNDPCAKVPAAYPFDERVAQSLASSSSSATWLVMDTYYYTTGRFLTTLDWHVQTIPIERLGIGMMNRADLSIDDLTARFYAIDRADISWINIFLMPIDEKFLPFLQRWKTRCAGCGKQTILGCYDMDIACTDGGDDRISTNVMSPSRSVE